MTPAQRPKRARSIRSRFDYQGRGSGQRTIQSEERGFTLIELLVVVAIIPLVVGAISVALVSVISQQTTVSNKVSDSGDASIVSANFVKDVQSGVMMTTDQTVTGLRPSPCGGGVPILSILWGSTETSYTVVTQANSHYTLFRYSCQGATLTTALSLNQTGITSLAVSALPSAVALGDQLTISSGNSVQTVTASGPAAIGATTVSVLGFTSNYSQPIGTAVFDFDN